MVVKKDTPKEVKVEEPEKEKPNDADFFPTFVNQFVKPVIAASVALGDKFKPIVIYPSLCFL